MAHTRAWDSTTPAKTDSVGNGATEMTGKWVDIDERMSVDHRWGDATATGVNFDGVHKHVTLTNDVDPATGLANRMYVKAKDVNSVAELHTVNENSAALQLTSATSMGATSTAIIAKKITIGSNSMSATGLVGDLTGDVTGNVTGDVTGDLTGAADAIANTTAGSGSLVLRYSDFVIASGSSATSKDLSASNYVAVAGLDFVSGDAAGNYYTVSVTGNTSVRVYSWSTASPGTVANVASDTTIRVYFWASS
jgi:hypothetical protein